jgi:exopolyphosphatase/guanosine-5'-triphosphate,3'-diphosphate pyrophosphatase
LPVAAVDIGSNSTRLLIAEGEDELARESIVTRLAEGVDSSGRLGDAPQQRVLDVLSGFRLTIEAHGCERATAVLTSAVRDAANGKAFSERVQDALGFEARILSGDEEARLTYAGATTGRDGEFLVIDIGGGSTELVLGSDWHRGAAAPRTPRFHVSTQIGVVRHGERHLHGDPPSRAELEALTADVRTTLEAHVPVRLRERELAAIAVAGTPTQSAAIDLALEHYDPARVEGHVLTAPRLRELLDQLAALPLAQRREIRGLDPARAPVIVAGIAILLQVMYCFDLDKVEVSERDILWGIARSITAGS